MSASTAFGHVNAVPISLEAVTKSYDRNEVIPPMDVALRAGEFTVVLGPSGCGKSTLLQMIAGLERVSGGRILFGGREVQGLEPKLRGCAMVFQNYALYPHMSVFGNIAYSLKIAGVSKAEQRQRVDRVALMLGLADYLERRPSQLSGGQRQRVAIARAIVREPSVLLFDEPLSNLDAQLRHDTRVELAALHKRIGATTVFVTHDQVEAMTLADRILILNEGRIEQFGTPKEVYHRPATVFVAQFIGAPPMNIMPVAGDGVSLLLPDGRVLARARRKGGALLGVRPEDVRIVRGRPGEGVIAARLRHREDLGSHSILTVELGNGVELRVATPLGEEIDVGAGLHLRLPHDRLHLFDDETGQVIADAFQPQAKEEECQTM